MIEKDELDKRYQNNEIDHRKFGLERKLFCFPPEGGAGFPFWLPNGYKLLDIVKSYVNNFQETVCGIKLVKTPVLGKKELYCKTGHLSLYSENIFEPISEDGEEYVLRPMTCPHHILLVKEIIQGYRQLPYLVGENSILHRHEYSGGLLGLKRVRTMELIDTHIFLLKEHSREWIETSLNWIWILLETFGVKIKEIVLASRSNKEKYIVENEAWNETEDILFGCARSWAEKKNLSNLVLCKEGEAAFYGPKIDFNAEDSSNQSFTISTLQLDTLMCSKLDFSITDSSQKKVFPWIIHLGLIGTLERFIAYLLEQWRGEVPFWLSPIQVVVIPIDYLKFHREAILISKNIKSYGFRVEIDDSKERFSKKLFNASKNRVKIQVLVGEKEASNTSIVSFRELGDLQPKELKFPEFIDYLNRLSWESQKKR